ncbi:binding post-transcriptional regulator [Stemphylium lycopersici]|nr:binding post-transcriptional regulator [Stemphylium lycopersici]
MSFNNGYPDQFQGPPQGDMNNPTPQPGDMGQPMDTSANGFPSQGNMGPPGSAGGDGQGQGSGKTTLWMGELEPWIDENFVRSIWYNMGETVNVKMIRDKFSGNAGYCFVDFSSPEAAAKALTLNGQVIPNSTRPFKLNWASGGGLADRRQVSPYFPQATTIANSLRSRDERGPEFSIFVGDLGPEVTEFVLVQLFQNKYPSTKSAKIMSDPISGMSRGYGFVRFASEEDQQKALTEMQGVYCGNRPMRISTATPKNKSGGPGGPGGMGMPQGPGGPNMGMYSMGAPPMGNYYGAPQPMNQFTDPNNTTVFVGGLSGYVTEDELRSFFQGFGEITYVKIPPGKGCGFVQFVQRHAAEMAINQMQGYPIGNSRVRLSWGRSQNNSGPAGTPYRPAPPPPVPFGPGMGMPPQHPYGGGGGGYGPMMKASMPPSYPPTANSLSGPQSDQNTSVASPLPPDQGLNHNGGASGVQYGQTGVPAGFGAYNRLMSPQSNDPNSPGLGSSDFNAPLMVCIGASSVPSKTLHLHHSCRLLVALLDLNSSNPTPAMRYDDWDVILFPKDSHVPIQEFKTACYVSPEESDSRIAHEKRSLTFTDHPTSQRKPYLEFPPFHKHTLMQNAWDARDPHGRIRIMLSEQLISKTASPGNMDLGISNDLVCFSFQHAPKEVLDQAGVSWPIRNPLYLTDAFERDKLFHQTSPTASWTTKVPASGGDIHMQSPLAQSSKSMSARPRETELSRRPNAHLPLISHFLKQPMGSICNGRAGIWDDNFSSLGDSADDISMDTWSTKRTTSGSTGDYTMPDYTYTSTPSFNGPPWMRNMSRYSQSEGTDWNDRPRKEREKQLLVTLREDQLGQIIEAMSPPKRDREISYESSAQRHEHVGRPPTTHAYFPPRAGPIPPINRPSSAALARKPSYTDFNSTLRNAFNKQSPNKQLSREAMNDRTPIMHHPSISSNKESCHPSQSRLPTPFPHANRVPTPNPFVPRLPTSTSDVSMIDHSSSHSSMYCFNQSEAPPPAAEPGKFSSAHGPSNVNIRSRKEGLASDSPKLSEQVNRHDQSLLPAISTEARMAHKPMSKEQNKAAYSTQQDIPGLVEIIDVDAIDPSLDANESMNNSKLSPFKPNHRTGISLSSIDSTGRLERQLFSALGEELGSFDHQIDTTGMGPELAQALGGTKTHSELSGTTLLNPTASDFEPTVKRKRQGTFGGDRNGSPMNKREKAESGEAEEQREVVVCMRGD